jgi:hypothetical protein
VRKNAVEAAEANSEPLRYKHHSNAATDLDGIQSVLKSLSHNPRLLGPISILAFNHLGVVVVVVWWWWWCFPLIK